MPPQTEYGPFPDTPIGGPIMDDIQIIDPYDDRDVQGGGGKKNKKNSNDTGKPSQSVWEGFLLERVKPQTGDKLSWRRCGRRPLPSTQEQLAALGKNHRKRTGKTTNADFKRLSGSQQELINRIIEEKKLNEKSKTAEWSLDNVQTIERRVGLMSSEVYKLQVVIKRTDKGNDKSAIAAIGNATYLADDIIDLSIPLKKKDNKKNKTHGPDLLDDPLGISGLGLNDLPPREEYREPYREPVQHWDQPPPPPPNHFPPQQAPLPPEWQQNPYDQQQPGCFPADPHGHPVGGARDFNNNPFQPHPNVALPGQFDDPIGNNTYPHPHQARSRTRSAERYRSQDRNTRDHDHRSRSRSNHRRRSLARRPSYSSRRQSHRRDDSVEDVTRKVERMYSHGRDHDRSSTDSNYDERSLFSRSDRDRYSRGSPPTSVDDAGSEYYPRNNNKKYWRDARRDIGDERRRHRSSRYQDAEYYREPAYTYDSPRHRGEREGRYSPDRRDRRPLRIDYHDDYPAGRAAEPRYLPPVAPMPPMLPRRNTTDFFGGGGDKRGEYFAGGGGREYQDWRREREEDAFEAGRRAEQRRVSGAYHP